MYIQSLPQNQRASIILLPQPNDAKAATRLYSVRPASPEGNWGSPVTHKYYVEIVRLADGKRHFNWMAEGWSDTDSWAHPRFQHWEREFEFWRSERELQRLPGVKFDEHGFVIRSSVSIGGR